MHIIAQFLFGYPTGFKYIFFFLRMQVESLLGLHFIPMRSLQKLHPTLGVYMIGFTDFFSQLDLWNTGLLYDLSHGAGFDIFPFIPLTFGQIPFTTAIDHEDTAIRV